MDLQGALAVLETTVVKDVSRSLDAQSRTYLRFLCLSAIVAFAATMLGPVVGGSYGYEIAYLAGWFGPLLLVVLAVSLVPIAYKHGWV